MKTRKTLRALAAGLIAAVLTISVPTTRVWASDQFEWLAARMLSGEAASGFNSAISTHTSLIVGYTGGTAASPSGLVAVAAGGAITFTQGAAGSEAATTEFECPVSGALGGVIDVTNAACDTLGEVCDVINGSGTGSTYTANTSWRCVILDGLYADSSNDTLVTISATQAARPDGLALLGDTAVSFDVARALLPAYMRSLDWYVDGSPLKQLKPRPFEGLRSHLFKTIATSTYGSGTSTIEVSSVRDVFNRTQYGQKLTETATTIWSQAGGATTVAGTADFTPLGLQGETDAKIVVKLNNSAANTVTTLTNWALQYPWRK